MFVMNLGCSPHFKQRGEVGFWRSCFSMPHRMSGRPYTQVKKWRHYWGGFSSPSSQAVGRAGAVGRGQGSHERHSSTETATALPDAAWPAAAPPAPAARTLCKGAFSGNHHPDGA